jgi:hypothetical protein
MLCKTSTLFDWNESSAVDLICFKDRHESFRIGFFDKLLVFFNSKVQNHFREKSSSLKNLSFARENISNSIKKKVRNDNGGGLYTEVCLSQEV